MSLVNVWLQTLSDGLVRADQVTGIDAHQTPALTGKPSRWLLDVVLPASTGSGAQGGWSVSALHRTLVQTTQPPSEAPMVLARLLAQLDVINAAGVIVATRTEATDDCAALSGTGSGTEPEELSDASTTVRFRFVPFPTPPPGHHTGTEYL